MRKQEERNQGETIESLRGDKTEEQTRLDMGEGRQRRQEEMGEDIRNERKEERKNEGRERRV